MEFTIHEAKMIAACDPAALPDLWVHRDGWAAAPIADTRGRIHMGPQHLAIIRESLPVEEIGPLDGRPQILVFRIALEKHHLEGGLGDMFTPLVSAADKMALLRDTTGQELE